MQNRKRWKVEIFYSCSPSKTFEIEEISELHDIIESGPDFRNLVRIEFTYLRGA